MNAQPTNDDEISIKQLLQIFWRDRYLIIVITLAATVGSLAAALLVTKKYEATTILSPVSDDASSSGRLSSLISQVGGGLSSLADTAGLSSGTNTQKAEIAAILVSEELTESYIRENNLLPILYHKDWDASRQQWKDMKPGSVPTLWKANAYFKKKVRFVTTDSKTGLVTLIIAWEDPKVAAAWANGLVKLTNDYMRNKSVAEAERNITYLTGEASKADQVGVKEAIYSILQDEIKKMMLARGSDEFALKVIDPAFAPEKPASPLPIPWTIMGFFGGFFSSLLLVFLRYWWRSA